MIFNSLHQQGQIRDALRCNDTILGQMCSKGIDKLRSVTKKSRVRKSMEQACLARSVTCSF
jgi:hypothetical protein